MKKLEFKAQRHQPQYHDFVPSVTVYVYAKLRLIIALYCTILSYMRDKPGILSCSAI